MQTLRNPLAPSRPWLLAVMTLALAVANSHASDKTSPPIDPDHAAKMARGLEVFKKHVRPVLAETCLSCHGGKKTEAELDVSDRESLLKGGVSGPPVILGKYRESLLYKLIAHHKTPGMPFKQPALSDEAVASFAEWIDNGAPYDEPLIPGKKTTPWTERVVGDETRRFWSFQSPKAVNPPIVKDRDWCRTPLDLFILDRLEAAGLKPNPPAERRQLIRRLYLDLIGLPPPPDEVEAFVRDTDPTFYEQLVDRLLASPHYGERWGRRWLDLARFAESHGFEHDYDRPNAYPYRDFVIQSLNNDLPYNTFLKWQIAGDEYEPDNPLALFATGFLAAGVHSTQITKNEVEKHRYDEMDDMLGTIGTSMLGLTIGCCRCHDHKFDPLPQRDYYRMLATFTTTVRSDFDVNMDPAGYRSAREAFDREHAPFAQALKHFETTELPQRFDAFLAAYEHRLPRWLPFDMDRARLLSWYRVADPEWRTLNLAAAEHLAKAPRPSIVNALISSEGLPAVRLHTQGDDFLKDTCFLRRGDPANKEGVATQGFLQVLERSSDAEKHWQTVPPSGWRTSYQRRAFAEWLTDVDQGAGALVARVIVNRLWQHHLGRGIVATPSDFGARGERPTHPELLDYLAAELIGHGWQLKHVHKLIVTSAAYMQSSTRDEDKIKADSDNRLCWRCGPRRLEAEITRDSLLSVSGALDSRMFGPGTLDEASHRRSIYFTVKRSKLVPMMLLFDAPDGLVGIADRPTTTIAPQALLLLNNPQVRAWARSFAKRIAPDDGVKIEEAVKQGYRVALSRPPTEDELADSVEFVNKQAAAYAAAHKADARDLALTDFCQVLMCLNEFVYLP
jgi:hypothetical protein